MQTHCRLSVEEVIIYSSIKEFDVVVMLNMHDRFPQHIVIHLERR